MCNTIGNSATDIFFFWGGIYPSLMQENSFSWGAFLSTRHLLFPSHLRDSASRILRHKMFSGIPSQYNYFIHKYCVKCYDSCSCQSCAVYQSDVSTRCMYSTACSNSGKTISPIMPTQIRWTVPILSFTKHQKRHVLHLKVCSDPGRRRDLAFLGSHMKPTMH